MSRAYRIRVSESLRRVIRASDHVSTQLELLDILPVDETAALLTEELLAQGFESTDEGLSRETDGVRVTIDPRTGNVTVTSESTEDIDLKSQQETYVEEEAGAAARKSARADLVKQAKEALEQEANRKEQELQKAATDRLESELQELQGELNTVVNRVTAQALKEKAARIGQIKELTEDPASGSMTIVLEV